MISKKELFHYFLNDLNSLNDLPYEIVVLNFVIFNTHRYDMGYKLSITGSKTYDSHNKEWVNFIDYTPPRHYSEYILGFHYEEPEVVLDFVITGLKEYLASPKFLQNLFSQVPHITTGFDDGDLIVIK